LYTSKFGRERKSNLSRSGRGERKKNNAPFTQSFHLPSLATKGDERVEKRKKRKREAAKQLESHLLPTQKGFFEPKREGPLTLTPLVKLPVRTIKGKKKKRTPER